MARKKFLLGICVFNEGPKIREVIRKFTRYDLYDILFMDDGSTDGALTDIKNEEPLYIIRNETNCGAGYGLRRIFAYAREHGYEAVIPVAGNNKDCPEDVIKLTDAIEAGYDFIQGSRYLKGGGFGQMPFYRQIATRYVHPWLFSFISGKKITDSTNGFRAIRIRVLLDSRIDLDQPWLDKYELEPYLFYKAIKLGYRVTEVPVTKIYPPKAQGYTKMKPFSGWWSILRPLVFLGLRIKK